MKLLMKEWKLCMHPTGYLMPLMAGLILVPGYPYGVCCFYVGLSIFFICLTAREDHDAGYTLMLPVSRQDAVRARILFLQQGCLKADEPLNAFREAWRIAECAGEMPPALAQAACGTCRTRDGFTVLVRKENAEAFNARKASLEEIMVHLEKEADRT